MTKMLGLLGLLSFACAVAQQDAARVIYGSVIASDGTPAKGLRVTASPLGVPLASILPDTRTDDTGHYRFNRIPWWGRFTVYADDREAGYSSFATGPAGPGHPPEVTISPEHPEARLDLHLPPKAGFLRVHLTNQLTGATISGVEVVVMLNQDPPRFVFSMGCGSEKDILLPSDKDLLLHVTSWGFREWAASVGKGKSIRVSPGSHFELDVQLAPEQP